MAALVTLICLFGNLGAMGLVGPDEPRYAWIARNMAETGDWITPRLYGQPWFEKPILYYWCSAAGFKIFHSPELAARMPSAQAALIAAVTIAFLTWLFYGLETAWFSLLIFPTTVAAAAFARAATPDMLFTSCLTIALAGATGIAYRAGALRELALDAPPLIRSEVPDRIAFGAGLGFATLAKGPAALILAGGGIGMWICATRKWKLAPKYFHPISIAAFALIALPWYVLCAVRNPAFVRTFLLLHNFERYMTPVFQHRQPVWYFGPIILMAALPWTALFAGVICQGIRMFRSDAYKDSPGFFFACWAIFTVLFFSFSQSKLPGYILPAIPPLGILLAVAAARAMHNRSLFSRIVLGCVGLTWIVGLAAPVRRLLKFLPPSLGPRTISELHALIEIAAVTGLLIFALAISRRERAAIVLTAALFACMILVANRRILPQLDPYVSARASARDIENAGVAETIESYQLQRSWYWGLNFYLRRELPEGSLQDTAPSTVVTNAAGLQQIQGGGRSVTVLSAPDSSSNAQLVTVQRLAK
jgi:4-amino-4-deoxy-L-arabinose transferase-like glycosyltransferase